MGGAVTDTTKTNFKKRAAAVAVASCLSFAPWLAEAAGLGKITVLSGLGQPLRAEIELNASRAELAGMSARLAPQSAFREAGIDYASSLYDLRFSIEKRSNGMPVLKVTSAKPVNDPFMDFLVELNWPAGPTVREYTFLLDPPEVAARAAGRPVSSAEARVVETVRGPAAAPATTTVRSETPRPAAVAPRATESKKPGEQGTHLVQQGETLRKIAGETKYDGVSLEQMLVGLFKKNPDAFIGDNINRLKAGAILNVPDKATVAAVPEAEARKVYVTQAGDWNAYRQKLAAATVKGQPKQEDAAQSAAGKITARVEEKASPTEQAKDQVKVSRAEAAAKGAAGGRPAAAVEEDLIAKDKALKEAQDRLAVLEKNVVELQKLVDMKTQRLAELQLQASGKKEEAKPAAPAEPPKPVVPAEPPKVAEAAPVVEAPKPAEEVKPAEPPKVAEAKPQEPVKAPAPVQAKAPESDFDPLPLIGGGGVLALLAGYFLLRRRRSEPEPELTAAIPGPSSLGPNSVFRMTGGQSVDTGNVPLQTGDFSQTGPGTIDTDEVDPVAEADVYMAYGRDAQAEEILIEALRKDPHRTAIHAKLLEIYSNRKSVKQFDTLASELYAQTGGVGAEWEKVAAMGAALDPENPLYSGGRSAAPAEAGSAPASAQTDGARATMVLPGTLGVMAAAAAAEELAVPQLPVEEVPEPAVQRADEIDFGHSVVSGDVNALDFDLDSPAQSPDQTFAQAPEVVESLPEMEAIDFDLGAPAAEPFATTEVNPQLPASETLVMGNTGVESDFSETFIGFEPTMVQQGELVQPEAGLIDFQLDTGVPAAETVVDPAAMVVGGDYGSDTMVNPQVLQESMIGNNLLAETVVNPAVVQSTGNDQTIVDGNAGMNLDVNADAAEFDVSLSESVFIGQPMPVPEFDMTSINLDLGADATEQTQVADFSGNFAGDAMPGGQGNEEVGTKLALAKAYEEMGDHAQARELLQEVMAEGNGDLVEQAREIIGRLRG